MVTSLGQVVVILLVAVCLVEGGYDPECHKDCSWKNWQDEIQSCSQNNTMGKFEESVCPNFFHSSIKGDQPVEPIQNVTISHYSATYTFPGGNVHPYTFTGLNISFDLDPAGFGFYTGAIIEITGVKYQAFHFSQLGCFYLSFDGNLTSSAVTLPNNKTKRMFFDCARQLAPGSQYLITIRMAPFTSNQFEVYYQIPSCFHTPKDAYCKVSEEDLPRVWSPAIFDVDVSGYREAVLTFKLAPYDFDHYKVWLQEIKLEDGKQVNVGKRESCVDIYVNNNTVTEFSYCSQEHNFTVTPDASDTTLVTVKFTGVKPSIYLVELLPWPLENTQMCQMNGVPSQCYLTSSVPHEVKVHDKDVDQKPITSESQDPINQESVGKGEAVAIIVGTFGCVLLAVVALIIYRTRQIHKQDIYRIDPDVPDDNDIIRVKRIFVVHSFDHPSHNNVVLKLCNFLSNCCKFDVHTTLWSSNNIGKGVNEWIARECEVADKVIVLCSQGTQLKWRANYRDVALLTKEEAHGDIFSIFLRVQRVEYEKNPEKFVVAYMSYSCEADIPQPLTFLMKYQLMDHMEQMYFHLNNMKKHNAKRDFNIPVLHNWASATDAGVYLKIAVDEMKKKIEKDDNWFFSYNEIPDEIALCIRPKQQRIMYPINNQVTIFSESGTKNVTSSQSNLIQVVGENQEADGDNISTISDTEFQMANLASFKQLTGFQDVPVYTNGHPHQSWIDSGISMSLDSESNDHQSAFMFSDKLERKWSNENHYGIENIV